MNWWIIVSLWWCDTLVSCRYSHKLCFYVTLHFCFLIVVMPTGYLSSFSTGIGTCEPGYWACEDAAYSPWQRSIWYSLQSGWWRTWHVCFCWWVLIVLRWSKWRQFAHAKLSLFSTWCWRALEQTHCTHLPHYSFSCLKIIIWGYALLWTPERNMFSQSTWIQCIPYFLKK